MTSTSSHADTSPALPARWQTRLQGTLGATEELLAWAEIDLDAALDYQPGLMLLTSERLLDWSASTQAWHSWPHQAQHRLTLRECRGLAQLELHDSGQRLMRWHMTLAQLQAMEHLIARHRHLQAGTAPAAELAYCPDCLAPLPAGAGHCPQCGVTETQAPSAWTLLRLWRFAQPYRGQLLAGFILTLLATAATLVPPYMTMPLMDNVLIPYQNGQPIDFNRVSLYLGGLLAAALLAWLLDWARSYILALVSERIGADLRTTTYDHLLKLSLEYFGAKRTGDLMARIGSESDRICVFLSLHLMDFATDVLMILMTAAILISIDPWLALVTLLPLPLIGWLIHQVRDRLRTGFDKAGRVWSEITNVLADTIPGIRVVKAFAQEERELARFQAANLHNLAVNDRVNRTWSLFSPSVTLLTEIGLLVVWGFGIWQVSTDQITVGVLTAFIAYIGRFYTRLDSMSRIVSVTQKAATATKRLFDILDHVSSVPEARDPVTPAEVHGAITLDQVSFRYGHRPVIHELSLSIQPGEMIGLVGHSGSSKSTLVNLICRFYDVSSGSIRLDGHDIRKLRISDYRRQIGLVLQEPFLFYGTVADNIAYGRPDASRADIIAAARAAHAHEFILRLPLGYDSQIGERGQGLSGGERQRISIARALLIDPRILILDEATSSVDTETEKEIQQALDNLVAGRTTIAIAHRLSTLRRADRLVVMDQGRIVEIGQHHALMAQQGAYWRLYQAQARHQELLMAEIHDDD